MSIRTMSEISINETVVFMDVEISYDHGERERHWEWACERCGDWETWERALRDEAFKAAQEHLCREDESQ